MRLTVICCLLGLFLLESTQAPGQGTYVPPKIPGKVQKEFDAAVLASKAGPNQDAFQTILSMSQKYPTWTLPRQELSRLYYESGDKQQAIAQLEQAIALDTLSQLPQLYTLARLYDEITELEKAHAVYSAFIDKSKIDDPLRAKAKENLADLEAKQRLLTRHYDIEFHPFSDPINTTDQESLGCWTLDGQELIFTRKVNGQEDLFVAHPDSLGHWKIEPFTYNTPQNEGAHAISPDGRYLIFTSCNRPDGFGGCDMYISINRKGIWSRPVNMGKGFNTSSWDGQPTFGMEGQIIFFSSNREGGFGGRDIWYMYQLYGDSWSNPENAGPGINTADNEESPFIHFDGLTMYFMRDGKNGLGGYDLYMSRKGIDGKWQRAENMGTPINSGANEGALTLYPDGKRAIITRENGENKNDLYEFELPEDFRAIPQQALKVNITDALTGQPVRANLEIFNIKGTQTIRHSQWTNEAGEITSPISRNTEYGIIVNAQNYIIYSTNLPPDTAAQRSMDIHMIPVSKAKDATIVLENIFFTSGSADLLPASDPELEKLIWTLRIYKEMKIEIRGHTDNVGDDAANQALSEARAKAVYSYLIKKGINADRLSYKGFGETQPIADNNTPEGRQKNRRTEFYIITN